MKIIIRSISSLIFMILASAVFSEPESSDIQTAVARDLSDGFRLVEFRFKSFPMENDASRGRVSIAGTIEALIPRVEQRRDGRDFFRQELISQNVPDDRLDPLLNLVFGRQFLKVYDTRVNVGDISEFSGTYAYSETVDGFDISGEINHEFCCQALTENDLENDQYISGGRKSRAVVETLLFLRNYEQNHIPKLAPILFEGLDGARIVHKNTGETIGILEGFDVYDRNFIGEWIRGPKMERHAWVEHTGRNTIFTNEFVNIRVLKNFQLHNNFETFQAGSTKELEMAVRFPYDADFSKLCVGLDDAAGWAAGPINLCWNGTRFSSSGNRYTAVYDTLNRMEIEIIPDN